MQQLLSKAVIPISFLLFTSPVEELSPAAFPVKELRGGAEQQIPPQTELKDFVPRLIPTLENGSRADC